MEDNHEKVFIFVNFDNFGLIPAASAWDSCLLLVMPGLVPGIPFHRFRCTAAWMPGTSPGMTRSGLGCRALIRVPIRRNPFKSCCIQAMRPVRKIQTGQQWNKSGHDGGGVRFSPPLGRASRRLRTFAGLRPPFPLARKRSPPGFPRQALLDSHISTGDFATHASNRRPGPRSGAQPRFWRQFQRLSLLSTGRDDGASQGWAPARGPGRRKRAQSGQ